MPDSAHVQGMFARIAKRYDLLNHVLSFGLDRFWWNQMARRAGAAPGKLILDVAAGTGDSSLALAQRGARVVTSDFTLPMLQQGPEKFRTRGLKAWIPLSVGADAQCLPFRDASFDGATICYGIRNVEDRPKAFREFHRVVKPGGSLTILEFSRPRWGWLRLLYRIYSQCVLPRLGAWVSGDPGAYAYLPESIQSFPAPPLLAQELEEAGFSNIRWQLHTGGIVAIHLGIRPRTNPEAPASQTSL